MAKKKKRPSRLKLSAALGGDGLEADSDEGSLDAGALAAVLSAEYPLIDISLILALLSDYDASSLESNLPSIRDQLGILEATIVPDPADDMRENAASSVDDSLNEITSGRGFIGLSMDDETAALLRELEDPRLLALREDAVGGGSEAQILKLPSSSEGTSRSSDGARASSSATSDLGDPEWQSEFEVLRVLFPDISDQEINEVQSSKPSISDAIDELLNLDMLRNVQENGFWPGEEEESDVETWKEVIPKRSPVLSGTAMSRSASGASVSSLDSNKDVLMPPRNQNASKRKKKDTLTIPLVDTLQRKASPSPRSSRQTSRGTSPNRFSALSGPSSNAWDTMYSLAATLSDLLPQPPNYFLTYFHSPDYHHPYDALRAALASIPSNRDAIDVGAEQILQDVYLSNDFEDAGRDAIRADLELCGNAAGSDVATVMDLMDLLAEVSSWAGDDDAFDRYDYQPGQIISRPAPLKSNTTLQPAPSIAKANSNRVQPKVRPAVKSAEKVIPGSKPASSSITHPTVHDDFGLPSPSIPASPRIKPQRQIHPQNYHKVVHARSRPSRILHPYASHIPSYARGVTPHDSTPGSLYRTNGNSEYTIEECMNRAAAERAKQQSAIRDVGKHWSGRHLPGGKSIGGAVAGHYALEARSANDRAMQWELKAARMVVDSQLQTNGHTIDLHHMTVNEARIVAVEAAERWYSTSKQSFGGHNAMARDRAATFAPAKSLVVITGVGRHSAGKIGVLGPAVATHLEAEGWRVERGEAGRGYLVIKGRR